MAPSSPMRLFGKEQKYQASIVETHKPVSIPAAR
jgi:hypothetical protein